MRINTKELDEKVFQYIVDSIEWDGYNLVKAPETPVEKLQWLYDTFKAEYGWSIRQWGEVNAFNEWIQGLPTVFGIVFTNYDIIKLAESWGTLEPLATDSQQWKIINNYFNFMAVKCFKFFRKYGVK